tara:strand:- start:1701 stop:2363 length:663 start_codon:yes stop_codon:yes gene_type:complete
VFIEDNFNTSSKSLYKSQIKKILINIPIGGLMFSTKSTLKVVAAFTVVIALASCSEKEAVANTTQTKTTQAQPAQTKTAQTQTAQAQSIVLDVYKSPTCGCCKKWISHINENGFESKVHQKNDVSEIKSEKGIEPRYRSCHTAISTDGYVFEGHVPAKFIQQFMKETHADDVIGLAAPGMGMGSPGMEMGDKFMPYQVLLLKNDGSSEVYVAINSSKEQY